MKLAYIANARFPSERAQSDHVMAMCLAFAKAGHELTLFVPDRAGTVAPDAFTYYNASKTFTIVRVPCIDALQWKWLGPAAQWIQTVTFVGRLWQALGRASFDVVYSRELFIFLLGDRANRAQRVWESHRIHTSWFARRAMKRMDRIVTLTNASRERLVAMGFQNEQILVEPDAVDPRLFDAMPSRADARKALDVGEDEFLCLYTGKFTTMGMEKGIEESIHAVQSLQAAGLAIRLLAVGGTRDELERYAIYRGEGIELRGHMPQRELKTLYAAADVLLMPFPFTEHFAYYMSPLKLFEYLMSGVPMIVTDLPSVREIVDEQSAFIAKPGDAASLAACIREAMDYPDEAQTKAAAAQRIAGQYTWEERARRIGQIIAK
jgi:glycosyltransferase involved in cell wall biosynthesis